MNATTVSTPSIRAPKPQAAANTERRQTAQTEERRWFVSLLPSFVAGALFFALSIATDARWLIGVAVVLGPILMMLTFIYLCVSCDSNGRGWKNA